MYEKGGQTFLEMNYVDATGSSTIAANVPLAEAVAEIDAALLWPEIRRGER